MYLWDYWVAKTHCLILNSGCRSHFAHLIRINRPILEERHPTLRAQPKFLPLIRTDAVMHDGLVSVDDASTHEPRVALLVVGAGAPATPLPIVPSDPAPAEALAAAAPAEPAAALIGFANVGGGAGGGGGVGADGVLNSVPITSIPHQQRQPSDGAGRY